MVKQRITATNSQKKAIVELFELAKADGVTVDQFRATLATKHPEYADVVPSSMSLSNWRKKKAEGAYDGPDASPKAAKTKASSRTGQSLLQEFEEQFQESKNKALLDFLEGKVQELRAQLSAAEMELRNQRVKMGLENPIVEE